MIQRKMSPEDAQMIETYNQRVAAFQEEDKKVRIGDSVADGQMIDFWSERRWREGKIAETKIKNDKKVHVI